MRGEITTFDHTTGTGAIKGQDGSLYVFAAHNLQSSTVPQVGNAVDFVPEGSTATQIFIIEAATGSSGYSADDGTASHDQTAHTTAATAGSLFTAPPVYETYDFKSAMLSYVGRMRRQHFGISFLIILGASIILGLIPILGQIAGLLLIYPMVAITIKRLHDMGKSGWLTLVPIIGSIVSMILFVLGGAGAFLAAASAGDGTEVAAMGSGGLILVGAIINLVTNLGFLIWIAFTNSQPGPNQYGPNPKGL